MCAVPLWWLRTSRCYLYSSCCAGSLNQAIARKLKRGFLPEWSCKFKLSLFLVQTYAADHHSKFPENLSELCSCLVEALGVGP